MDKVTENHGSLMGKVLRGQVEGKRPRGRPRKRWSDDLGVDWVDRLLITGDHAKPTSYTSIGVSAGKGAEALFILQRWKLPLIRVS